MRRRATVVEFRDAEIPIGGSDEGGSGEEGEMTRTRRLPEAEGGQVGGVKVGDDLTVVTSRVRE